MKKYLINYSNITYYFAQKRNSESAKSVGGVDEIIQYNYDSLDNDFKLKNANILNQTRGAGY